MSDDGWYGESQEPVPGSYGRGRRAAQGQQPQPGQYAQQYPQDPYQSDQYPQDYSAQSQASYYDELGPRSAGPNSSTQDWNTGQQGYTSPQAYPQYGQQPQTPYSHRAQPQQPRTSDPYASGSYSTGSYSTDAYASPSDPYASDPYASGSYARPARDPNGGSYASGARDGYSTGGYPTAERDPRQSSGSYPTNSGYATGGYAAGGYPAAGPGAPGRGPANPVGQPQGQPRDPYGRRRAANPTSGAPSGYAPYESDDDDEFPARSSRRAPAYGGETDSRTESPAAGRSRRRAAPSREEDDERFSLIGDEDGDGEPGTGRGRKLKQKRGRNCLAVFIAFLVIAGGLGYGGYKGVQWYQSKYGPAPDYVSTTGTGTKVAVNIPTGSGGRTIGGLLFNAGIVKSQRAFTDACNANAQCATIQAGTYLLPQGISAAAAIADLLDPKNKDSKSQLITYGGERAAQIFASLESKTGWSDADIRAAIAGGRIDLPSWDTGQPGPKFPYAHIEGFIASESYVLTDYKTPTDLLKKMVDDQLAVFSQEDLANQAGKLGVTEYKLLIIASLARAEAGSNTSDLNKIAGVVFNRFNSPMQFAHLGFDTSTLYGMGNTGTVPDNKDTTNPYNTSVYGIKGLPPSPIDNPDQPSIDAAVNPNRANDYFYFCATPDGVQYASNNAQWQALGAKYKGLCGSGG